MLPVALEKVDIRRQAGGRYGWGLAVLVELTYSDTGTSQPTTSTITSADPA